MPAVNMGKVKNQGYEIEVKWDDKIGEWGYNINANMSYSKNKIVFQDEVEPNEPYMWATGRPVGSIIGYVADGSIRKLTLMNKAICCLAMPILM